MKLQLGNAHLLKKKKALVLEIKTINVVYIFMEGGMAVLCGK